MICEPCRLRVASALAKRVGHERERKLAVLGAAGV